MKLSDTWINISKKTTGLFSKMSAGTGRSKKRSASRAPASGLRLASDFVEWTTLRQVKDGFEVMDSNKISLAADPGNQPDAKSRDEKIKAGCSGIKGAVSMGVAPDKMLMRVTVLPTADPSETANMIKLQADTFSPFPDDRVLVSHEILIAEENSARILITAVQREPVEEAGLVLKQAGLNVQRIDAEAMAWWCLISEKKPVPDAGRYLFLVLEPAGGVWIAVQQKAPLAFRTVNSMGELPFDEYVREIAEDAAAFLLSLDMEHGNVPLSGLDVWCRGFDAAGLANALQAELQHATGVHSLDDLPALSEGLARRFAGTYLLPSLSRAHDGHAVLDLVPESWRSALMAQRTRRRLLAATVGGVAIWLAAMSVFFGIFYYQKYSLAAQKTKLEALQKSALEIQEMQKQAVFFEQYLDRKFSALESLRQLSATLPSGVKMNSFTFTKTTKQVVIQGDALTVPAILDFKQALEKSQLFGRVEQSTIQQAKRKDTNVQTFSLTCKGKEGLGRLRDDGSPAASPASNASRSDAGRLTGISASKSVATERLPNATPGAAHPKKETSRKE